MLTRLLVRNFKRFDEIDVELDRSVVLIGPNNSGKTSALQALALWDVGARAWLSKRGFDAPPQSRPGVTINRKDLLPIPVPAATQLWRGLHVRNVDKEDGKTKTRNIRIEILVEGVWEAEPWSCGFEFDYSNEESFYCRPLRKPGSEDVPVRHATFTDVPEAVTNMQISFLNPMSGLAPEETKLESGRINVLLGQGETAQVFRNVCYQVYEADPESWNALVTHIDRMFGVEILPPKYVAPRGEITMGYKESGVQLDLSSSGRGLQQTLFLLAHLYAHPRSVLLLDEPDAHLEALRQRETFQLIGDIAEEQGSQIIAASHSEVVLNEAAGRAAVIAFVGKPHRLDDRGSQLVKALTEIGYDQYYQAEQKGWVLYLEGATDLAILQAFAEKLGHDARHVLARPFVHYIGANQPKWARRHFQGLREAKPDLVGIAMYDRLEKELPSNEPLRETMWQRREIENYFCCEEVLLLFARSLTPEPLFTSPSEEAMRETIGEVSEALATLEDASPWSPDIKASERVLDRVFQLFFKRLGLPLLLRKNSYHELAKLMPAEDLAPEIGEKLDAILEVASRATPAASE